MWPFGPAKPLGQRGEALARRYLKRRGMKILARNFRCPVGEIDLIALDRSTRSRDGAETIAFVEVKARRSDTYTDPAAAVDSRKRGRLRKIAQHYLSRVDAEGFNARFDIVSIVFRDGAKPEVQYIPDAF